MRERSLIEIEITAERWAFIQADANEDYTAADEHYRRMDELLEEYVHIPRQRTAS